jgi:hypothetical protein
MRLVLFACFLVFTIAQSASSGSSSIASPTSPGGTPAIPSTGPSATSSRTASASSSAATAGAPPDVLLNVPNLSVGRIELDVENLKADINLAANVASLVSINAGVAVSIQKVNLTIVDVQAQLELVVRLGHLVDIVNRVFESLDLNPLLISTVGNLTNVLQPIVGAVDGLLGSVTQGGNTLSFLVDNLGNIVQQVTGASGSPVTSIVGNYASNMTFTGATQTLQNGLVQKTYKYLPLNSLVNIVFNAAGQVVQASVVKQTGAGATSSGVAVPSVSTAAPVATSSAAGKKAGR